jgi:hypothetical protein
MHIWFLTPYSRSTLFAILIRDWRCDGCHALISAFPRKGKHSGRIGSCPADAAFFVSACLPLEV